jgi:subtilase family serine protease
VVQKTAPGNYVVEVAGNRTVFTVPFTTVGIIILVAFAVIILGLIVLALLITLRRRTSRS